MADAQDTLSRWDREQQEKTERSFALQERALDQQDRMIAAQERLAELNHHVEGDTAADRLTAFFQMPTEQQDFRLREESVAIAARLGGSIETVITNAKDIMAFIRGDG